MEFKFTKLWAKSRLHFIRDYMIGPIKLLPKTCTYTDVHVQYLLKHLVILMSKYNKYNAPNKFKYYNMTLILGTA